MRKGERYKVRNAAKYRVFFVCKNTKDALLRFMMAARVLVVVFFSGIMQ